MSKILSISGMSQDSESIVIVTETETISMYHYQDCCESVFVEDVVGDVEKHIGAELYEIIEKTSKEPIGGKNEFDSFTYTFYTIKTSKGYLDVRWIGSSNGYYSESVTIERIQRIQKRRKNDL